MGEEEGDKSKEGEIEGSEEVKGGGKGKEVVVVMDTPERARSQIATPVSKFEESPVFNFLNNLSPIKPVKSVHITQTLNALSFASLPSVFTSPHVSSLKESRFLRRHQFVDPSKPEFSSDNGNKTDAEEGCTKVAHNSNEQQENVDPGNSHGEVSAEQSSDCSKLAVELVRTLNYECTPISSSDTSCPTESKCVSEFTSTSAALVPFQPAVSGKGLFGNGVSMEGMNQTSQSGDATGCDWENLVSDADLLIFDSPKDVGTAKKLLDPSSSLYTHISTDMQNIPTLGPVEQGDINEMDNPSTQPGDGSYLKEFSEIQDMLAGSSLDNNCEGGFSERTDSEPVSHLYRGMRRRCLVFEMAGTRRKHFDENSNSVSPILSQDGNTSSSDKQLLPMRSGNDSSRHILPGIGLHLNALATAPKEYKVVKQDASVSGRLVIAPPSSTANFPSLTSGQEPVNQSLAMTSMERDMDPVENGVLLLEDANQASTSMIAEEFNQTSPKKKRRKVEQAAESEGCKRCNCKKSKCLKLYCECFAAGVYCVEPCSCQECFNKPIHEDTVLATRKQIESRNPLAFAPKVIRSSDSMAEAAGDDSTKTPASARHKRGCNCKKSGCLKKYCECYQGGVGCSISCRCEGCKNAFGRKDGSVFVGTEAELEEDETEVLEKSVRERASHKTIIQNDTEQNPESAPPATPFRFARPSVQAPFSSKKKPPRSSFPSIGTSSLYASQGLAKTAFLPPPQPKFDKHFEAVTEDEMPEILQGNGSPISGVKSASPSRKRVSPPHCNFGMSPGRRSSRKLILQSIPSFPSLTPKH